MREVSEARLAAIEASLARIEHALAADVPPVEERQHISDNAATAEQVDQLAERAPIHAQQLAAIEAVLEARMPNAELRDKLQDELFFTQQLSSIMQGTRADIVEMRATLLRQAALLTQVLRSRVEDEQRAIAWAEGDTERRRAG